MTNDVTKIYEMLLAHYGNPRWWPATANCADNGLVQVENRERFNAFLTNDESDLKPIRRASPYEVIVGAILVQNTNWMNVERAIANFGKRLSPKFVCSADMAELIEIIRPAGFYNQKAACLKATTDWFGKYGYDVAPAREQPLESLRAELLNIRGIGNETADCILLYALNMLTFVIDAYTMRIFNRIGLDIGQNYISAKAYFEAALPKCVDIYNNYHALIVIHSKTYCRKQPKCDCCPLSTLCQKFF